MEQAAAARSLANVVKTKPREMRPDTSLGSLLRSLERRLRNGLESEIRRRERLPRFAMFLPKVTTWLVESSVRPHSCGVPCQPPA